MSADEPEETQEECVAHYVTKDSGEKAVHSDGVQRDTQAGKTKFTLLFPRGVPMKDQLVTRIAELYTRGGEKYGDRNWENSCAPDTLDHHLDALWRHFMSFFFEENTEEDHAAAIFWNINAVELTRRNIRKVGDTVTEKERDSVPSIPVLALRDRQDDYWWPNEDGTFSCWVDGTRPIDSLLKNCTQQSVQDSYGPVKVISTRPEEGFPWDW